MADQPSHRIATAKIVLIYALFGFAWIYGSDTVVSSFFTNPAELIRIGVLKGCLFILCTAMLLYLLIGRFARQLSAAKAEQIETLKNYEALFNATNEAILVHDAETGRVMDVNERMLEIFGYDRAEALALNLSELSEGEPFYSQADALDKIRKALSEGPQVFEWRSRTKAGKLFWSDVSLKSVTTYGHDKVIAVVRDVSDRKQAAEEKAKLESQLQQAQKMEFVGRLAGGVAHDFNNMLTVIIGHAEIALMKIDPSEPLAAHFAEIRKTAQRSAELTSQLLAFARKQSVAPRLLDLNGTVASLLTMLQRLIGEHIQLAWQPASDPLPVKMDPSQINQILANLCVNARDAIDGTGTITIRTASVALDEEFCAAYLDAVPGDYVLLTVSDDGCGIDSEILAHIFEPFFTTKGPGTGTGLGLATVYGIVKQNSGIITIGSESGRGTSFAIYLPRYEGVRAEAEQETAAATGSRGSETILLVEDERAILDIASPMLSQQGYTVLAASTPSEGLKLARRHSGRIHLLVTDVIMPEMNGLDLANKLQLIYPDMKRLFISGYTADVIAHHGVLDEGVHFLQKPFSLPVMASRVRDVLDAG